MSDGDLTMKSDLKITAISFERITVSFHDEKVIAHFVVVHTSDKEIKGYFGPVYKHYISSFMELSELIVGMNPLHTNAVWDKLWNSQIGGRTGVFMEFLSAVDCALWDIKGKYYQCPVYELLGGPVREVTPCYASMLGFNETSSDAVETAMDYLQKGFRYQKWPIRGYRYQNLEEQITSIQHLVVQAPQVKFMLDVFGQWNGSQLQRVLDAWDKLPIYWLEEPLLPEYSKADYGSGRIPIALGEHLYNLYEFVPFVTDSRVAYLQPDIGRCGGITEGLRIIALAKAYNKRVVPHGHYLVPAIHLALTCQPLLFPGVEYHITIEPRRQCFYKNSVSVVNGEIVLPYNIGLGMEYDDQKITKKELLAHVS